MWYYEDEAETKEKGKIDMREVSLVRVAPQDAQRIELITAERTWALRPDTPEEAAEWVEILSNEAPSKTLLLPLLAICSSRRSFVRGGSSVACKNSCQLLLTERVRWWCEQVLKKIQEQTAMR